MYKQLKDRAARLILGGDTVPSGLAELHHYFRTYEPIHFKYEKQDDGSLVAVSDNFRYGSIITRATRQEELDEKIADAILTTFEVPSSYAKDAAVHRVDRQQYAFE
jgi:hypothetical protein